MGPEPSWKQLKSRMDRAPQEIGKFIERRTGCNHWDGEVGSPYAGREQMIQMERKKLRCDDIDSDERKLRNNHRRTPKVLQLITDTKDLPPELR